MDKKLTKAKAARIGQQVYELMVDTMECDGDDQTVVQELFSIFEEEGIKLADIEAKPPLDDEDAEEESETLFDTGDEEDEEEDDEDDV